MEKEDEKVERRWSDAAFSSLSLSSAAGADLPIPELGSCLEEARARQAGRVALRRSRHGARTASVPAPLSFLCLFPSLLPSHPARQFTSWVCKSRDR